ncbi:uncharacterized protein LOC116342520 [Contarinia nasturtii]|uniref:uncharacterized protein LOC116342520 n=1 Tax=Contarinia nasturtii TaxID=265458 RepID=UPI0012D47EB6|nr:uncharacterized protein LOC116342520 [Contarinia nasturtii]
MNKDRLIIDQAGFTNVYVSGCIINPETNQRTVGYGVFWGERNEKNMKNGTRKNTSENNGEIIAASMALNQVLKLNRLKRLCMNTRSNVLYAVLTHWIVKWKENNWRNESDGKKIRNCSSLKKLDKALNKVKERTEVIFNHIPLGNVHQNQADLLARTGAEHHCIVLANRTPKVKKKEKIALVKQEIHSILLENRTPEVKTENVTLEKQEQNII